MSAIIDFGCAAIGDPACDLVIAWTYLAERAREIFIDTLPLDADTWLRARAWALWKATYALTQMSDISQPDAQMQLRIVREVLAGVGLQSQREGNAA